MTSLRTIDWSTLDDEQQARLLARPAVAATRSQAARVAEIIAEVRRDGDAALQRLTAAIDGVELDSLAVTPAAFAALCRVWSSGVAPMPPKLNTTSSVARVRRNVAAISSGSSPRYCAHDSSSARSPSVVMIFGRCLSWRLPERISSPMMIAPIFMMTGYTNLVTQVSYANELHKKSGTVNRPW